MNIFDADENVAFSDLDAMSIGPVNINTEIGILFYDPELAGNASEHYDRYIDKVAFHVELVTGENGSESMTWTGFVDGKQLVFDSEPYASFWKKLGVNLMRVLPADAML
jgi:putative cardiolipin synthase